MATCTGKSCKTFSRRSIVFRRANAMTYWRRSSRSHRPWMIQRSNDSCWRKSSETREVFPPVPCKNWWRIPGTCHQTFNSGSLLSCYRRKTNYLHRFWKRSFEIVAASLQPSSPSSWNQWTSLHHHRSPSSPNTSIIYRKKFERNCSPTWWIPWKNSTMPRRRLWSVNCWRIKITSVLSN